MNQDELAATVIELATERGVGKTICPSEAARALAGNNPENWSRLMPHIRHAAIRLMKEGRITILRKGRPVDPDDFKGIYRIAIVGPEDAGTA